jgi:hypothetical protein
MRPSGEPPVQFAPSPGGGGSAHIERSEMRDGVGWRRFVVWLHPTPPLRVDPPPPGEGEKTRVRSVHKGSTRIRWRTNPVLPVALDCFALLAMTLRCNSAFSRHPAPEFCKFIGPNKRRAQETPGARCTRSPCAKGRKHTVVTTGSPEHRRFLRNGFNGFLRALLGDRALLPPSPPEKLASQELDASIGASGPHDFAVRVSAVRQKRLRVHRIPAQRS